MTFVHAQVRTEAGPKLFRLQVLREDDDWLTGRISSSLRSPRTCCAVSRFA
jgi:hypothetical protein